MLYKLPELMHQYSQICPRYCDNYNLLQNNLHRNAYIRLYVLPLIVFFLPYSMAQGMPSTLHSLFRIDNSLQVQCYRYSFLGRFSLGCSKRSSSIPSTRVSHES